MADGLPILLVRVSLRFHLIVESRYGYEAIENIASRAGLRRAARGQLVTKELRISLEEGEPVIQGAHVVRRGVIDEPPQAVNGFRVQRARFATISFSTGSISSGAVAGSGDIDLVPDEMYRRVVAMRDVS
jgi:hypothetical protein